MKDTYTIKKITELVGKLVKNDNDDLVVEVYGKEGLDDIVDLMPLLEDNINKQIAFKVVEEH